jgi:hypothetical protein
MRRALLTAALAVGLAGCPIPQPLPDYPAGTITPPRILTDGLLGNGAVTLIPSNCVTTAPEYSLSTGVVDTNTIESIEGRWFVNYDFRDEAWYVVRHSDVMLPNADTTNLTRAVPAWTFKPYGYGPPYGVASASGPPYRDPGILRVVELVVSNGFDPSIVDTAMPAVNRAPLLGFETQVFRWVFLSVPESPSVPCPP